MGGGRKGGYERMDIRESGIAEKGRVGGHEVSR